jgi:hypothetical protein
MRWVLGYKGLFTEILTPNQIDPIYLNTYELAHRKLGH